MTVYSYDSYLYEYCINTFLQLSQRLQVAADQTSCNTVIMFLKQLEYLMPVVGNHYF